MILDKFIEKKVNTATFDFTDQVAFLDVIDMNLDTYMARVLQNKNAAKRLLKKYPAFLASPTKCVSCNNDISLILSSMRNVISMFEADPSKYSKFKSATMGINSAGKSQISQNVIDNPCCPVQFYECITVCAATIEIFPAYLICCAACYGTFCCS